MKQYVDSLFLHALFMQYSGNLKALDFFIFSYNLNLKTFQSKRVGEFIKCCQASKLDFLVYSLIIYGIRGAFANLSCLPEH